MHNERLSRLTRVAMLGAMAFLLMFAIGIRLPFFAEFLEYDPGDIPAMIATYTLGPAAGVAVQGVKAGLYWASGKSTAGPIGVLANFLAGAALVLGASVTHRLLAGSGARGWVRDVVSAVAGTLIMSAVLIPLNAVLVYPVWGMKGAAAWEAALYISTPFNLFKGFVSSVTSLALYRRLQPFLLGRREEKAA